MVYVRRDRWSNLALATLAGRAMPAMERLITMGSALYRTARLSPDGQTIAYVRHRSDGMSLELQPVGGGAPRAIAVRAAILAVAWSPDGRHIAAAVGEESRQTGVEIFPAGDGGERRSYAGIRPGASLGWLGDSLLLVTGEGNRGLWRVPLEGGPPSLLRESTRSHGSSSRWRPPMVGRCASTRTSGMATGASRTSTWPPGGPA